MDAYQSSGQIGESVTALKPLSWLAPRNRAPFAELEEGVFLNFTKAEGALWAHKSLAARELPPAASLNARLINQVEPMQTEIRCTRIMEDGAGTPACDWLAV